jgi:DNA-binding transcriptional LysR family regulator
VVLNTNRLSLLRELASRGTIVAVSEALYLTPPAVSHQLAVLEREVGVPLLTRTARSVKLTDAGMRLVAHAETILAECESALADVATFSAAVSGTVHLSAFQTAAQSIAVPALDRLRTRYPALEVLTSEVEPALSVAALKAGQLDVALSHEWDMVPVPPDPGIDRHDLISEPAVAILPLGHAAGSGSVRLVDLAKERWCVAKETAATRQALELAAHTAGFDPQIVLESNDFGVIAAAVERGLGVAVVPRMTDLRGFQVAVRPLADPPMSRRIFAAVRQGSGRSPKVRAVLEALGDAAESLHPEM